jgi:hypothetical protein
VASNRPADARRGRSGIQAPRAGLRTCYLFRVVSSARPAPREGRSSWLAIAALAVVFLAFDLWIVLGGTSPGKVPGSLTAEAAATINGSQPLFRFAPNTLPQGALIACVTNGLRIEAPVPAPGRTSEAHADGVAHGGATIRVLTLPSGAVRARCGD